MADILTQSQVYQGSGSPTMFFDQFVYGGVYQGSSLACVVDLTPPVFAGLVSAVIGSRGQIVATWATATDPTLPIRYEVYVKANTSSNLFNTINIVGITDKLTYSTFTMPDGSFLENGTTYYVGVRAIDGVNNRDSNLISASVISTGVWVSSEDYEVDGAFAINSSTQLQGTLWALKNSSLATSTNSVMGTASYQVYDKAGNAVVGMAESGIVADSNGQYKITPVASTLATTLDHYMVKVTISVDGAARSGYVALIEQIPEYENHGSFSLNSSAQLVATFWATANDELISNPARLGTASYQVYDRNGVAVPLMTESGIVPDINGLYKIAPVTSSLSNDLTFYSVKVTIAVDGISRTNFLPILGKIPSYETHGVLAINASNQLQATLWATTDGIVKTGSGLGVANYTVYDYAGVAVVGLTQSGITSDVNGRFTITPVSAALLSDLTQYTIKIGIVVDNIERISYKGFTLLGN